jgi:isoleucyl-tRNA synthetase
MIAPYDFKSIEEGMLKLWKDKNIYERLKKRNKEGTPFYFLQGPPYTSGKLHIGHAWNNDYSMRYKRMRGFDVWDRCGYDMHGLPTERKVMELHKLKTKESIVEFGVEKFVSACQDYAIDKAQVMSKDLWKLGVWMDYSDPYYPVREDFISGEWLLVKKAHEHGRLYEGDKTLTWCPVCATAMAKHECDYYPVKEDSIFLKFKVKSAKNDYLLIWTTTPWTIAFNLAIMANPDVDYVKCKVDDEYWILAKPLANVFMGSVVGKSYEVTEEFKGAKLEGLEYEHPWYSKLTVFKELKRKHPRVHTVVLSDEYVDTTAGTGLVHCAPGCGPEDFEVGYKNNLPPLNTLSEQGIFGKDSGEFEGLRAKKDDKKFIEALKKDFALIAVTPVEHDYPHCERCRTPAIFRKTRQWFFKVEDLKEEMVKYNQAVYWVPKSGQNAFNSWLENLRDNSISKQRFWGTPVPIWVCEKCSTYEVMGSVAELRERAGKLPPNLHKPWIDEVFLKCECSGRMKRVPDILDVWIDAGTASWNCLYYPQRTDLFMRYFPADFILEAKEQVRGWFNLLMVASMIVFNKPCFKSVYVHGMLTDFEGKKMSKSLGNVISPQEITSNFGSDTLRYYLCETKPGIDLNFSWEDVKFKYKNLQVLWNVQNYLLDVSRTYGIKPKPIQPDLLGAEERYILSRLNSTIIQVTLLHDNYLLNEITPVIEQVFLDLSRDYIQFVREKDDKQVVCDVVFESLLSIVKVLSPSLPFIADAIYQNLMQEFGLMEDSVHLCTWPQGNEALINPSLEEEVRVAKQVITLILAKREQAGFSVRWPLARAEVSLTNPAVLKRVEGLVMQQANVKKLLISKALSSELFVELDTVLTPALEQEGYAREIARRLQALRKKAGLVKSQRVRVVVVSEFILGRQRMDELKAKVGADTLEFTNSFVGSLGFEDSAEIRGKKFKFLLGS